MSFESVNRINTLKRNIETVTGESYGDLTQAVQGLKNGYNTGGIEEYPYIDTSKMTDFSYFCTNNRMNDKFHLIDFSNGRNFSNLFDDCSEMQTVPEIDTSKCGNFSYMFRGCTALKSIPMLNTSNGTNFISMFSACTIQSIPHIDTSKGTLFGGMFFMCGSLQSVPKLDISNGISFDSMFSSCTTLHNIELVTPKGDLSTNTFQYCLALRNVSIDEGWNVSIYLQDSKNLTIESLHSMIENLADLTGQTPKTFQVGETNLAKIDAEHITMLDAKGWIYS